MNTDDYSLEFLTRRKEYLADLIETLRGELNQVMTKIREIENVMQKGASNG
jgi:prefoldin subunit 5